MAQDCSDTDTTSADLVSYHIISLVFSPRGQVVGRSAKFFADVLARLI